jgi:ABC-type maltose transport system permease subunit
MKMYLLAVTIIALATVIAWMVVETISVKREMKQLTDDYLKPKNDSFINPTIDTYNEIVEDLEKEEKYLNWVENAKKNNN